MKEPGDMEANEVGAVDTIGRLVKTVRAASVMIVMPDVLIEEFEKDTGITNTPHHLDLFELEIKLVNGDMVEALFFLHQVKDLTETLLLWHKDMHDAGKCNHDGKG